MKEVEETAQELIDLISNNLTNQIKKESLTEKSCLTVLKEVIKKLTSLPKSVAEKVILKMGEKMMWIEGANAAEDMMGRK